MTVKILSTTNSAELELCKSMQREEREVLEAIYPECVTSDPSSGFVKLEICIDFGDPRTIVVANDGTASESLPSPWARASSQAEEISLSLSSLPPLLLQLILPPNYPLYASPEIISLHATHAWFTRLPELQDALLRTWNAGEGSIYDWIELIRSGDFLLSASREPIRISHPAPQLIIPILRSHELSIAMSQFSLKTYACTVCLESYKGTRCLQLSCDHIFCRVCLETFWSLSIREGEVGKVGCPHPECVKAGREANEEEVVRVVTVEELGRWQWLREKRALDRDPHVVHCPLSFCQTPVPKPKVQDAEEGSGWMRLRTCHACGYSFCSFCKRTWHGPLSDCPINTTNSLVTEYMALEEGSPKRLALEHRYGKANIIRLVAKFEEDKSNAEWFKASTMACPGCHISVEKSAGCNHMTCAKCTQHFCYRCGTRIDGTNPYKHFNAPGPCFSKLFDFVPENDGWQPIEGFDALL